MVWSIPTQLRFRFSGNFGISLLKRLAKGLVITVAQRAGDKKLLYDLEIGIELCYRGAIHNLSKNILVIASERISILKRHYSYGLPVVGHICRLPVWAGKTLSPPKVSRLYRQVESSGSE